MNAALPAYPAYKDSGVPWLGRIPAHWEVRRLKGLLTRNDSGVWGDDFDTNGTIILRSTEQTVNGGWHIVNPARIRITSSQRAAALLALGDLVVTKSSGSPAHIGKTSLVSSDVAALDCCFSNFMQRLRPGQSLVPAFLWRLLNSPVGREQLVFSSTTTTGLGNLNGTILGECRFGLPPLPEQHAITRYLDHIDRRIRRYIRAKQRLIALLEEQKQVVIHQAVTGQIDVRTGRPYPAYKPSGVEWLGDVPEHWEMCRLKNVAQVQTGLTLGKNYGSSGLTEYPYLRVANVQSGFLDLKHVATVRIPHTEAAGCQLQYGDVLMTEGGDRDKLGRGCVWYGEIEGCLHQNHVFAVRADPARLLPEFLVLLMTSGHGRSYFEQTAKQTTNLASTNSTTLRAFPLFLPDISEQRLLLDQVVNQTESFIQASAATQREIALLREYRTRLIADVVTGQVDVRAAAAQLPAEVEEFDALDEAEAELVEDVEGESQVMAG